MQISTSVLPTLTVVTLMRCVTILLDRTYASVKQDSQAMEKHALVSGCGVVKNASKTIYVPVFSIFDLYIEIYGENDGHNLNDSKY